MKQSRTKTGQFTGYSDYELWDIYQESYAKAKKKLEGRGDEMYAAPYKNYEQFRSQLVQARNEGEKTGVKFVKDLVADSEYSISRKAAQASAKAFRKYAKENPDFAEEYGATINSWEFRRGLVDSVKAEGWFEMLEAEYYFLRSAGMSGKAAGEEISRLYYES